MRGLFNLVKTWSKIIFLIAGLAILYAYAMFQGGFVSWFLLYSFFPFILFSIMFALYSFKFWKIERMINQDGFYEVGDTVKVRIQISRKIPFPLYFIFISDSFNHEHKKVMLFPLFKRKIVVTYELKDLPRGEHDFGEIKVSSADFLGLIKKEQTFFVESKLIVYPKLQPLKNQLFIEKQVGDGTLARSLDHNKETMVSTSTREYQPGDRLSWINWKITAQRDNLMTKEFEKTEEKQIYICMDRSNKINSNSFEKIVSYTASLTDELYKNGYPVGLLSIGVERTIFPIKKIYDWRKQQLYHFAVVKNDSTILLPQLIEQEKVFFPEKGAIIFITDNPPASFFDQVKRLSNRQRKFVIILASTEAVLLYRKQLLNKNIIIKTMDVR